MNQKQKMITAAAIIVCLTIAAFVAALVIYRSPDSDDLIVDPIIPKTPSIAKPTFNVTADENGEFHITIGDSITLSVTTKNIADNSTINFYDMNDTLIGACIVSNNFATVTFTPTESAVWNFYATFADTSGEIIITPIDPENPDPAEPPTDE
jgi:hypothetical protein